VASPAWLLPTNRYAVLVTRKYNFAFLYCLFTDQLISKKRIPDFSGLQRLNTAVAKFIPKKINVIYERSRISREGMSTLALGINNLHRQALKKGAKTVSRNLSVRENRFRAEDLRVFRLCWGDWRR